MSQRHTRSTSRDPSTSRGWVQRLHRSRSYRASMLIGAIVGGLIAAGLFLRPILSRINLRQDFTWYDLGFRGLHPTLRYHSFEYPVTDVEFLQYDSRCSKEQIFLAPRGSAAEPGAVILEHNGEPVWHQHGFGGDIQDFRVQLYKGKRYLTFWSGNETGGRKTGLWYMMDETYSVVWELKPGGEFEQGDMHEFTITRDDTALVTIYDPTQADLSAIGGNPDGWILDCIFHEIDVETSEVLFEWRSSEHVSVDGTFKALDGCSQSESTAFGGCGDFKHAPFDYFHLNSVDKDERGNYLISARNFGALSYIDGRTGAVLWTLGGRHNDFTDESGDGGAPSFSWQHHARFHDNSTTISLLDNEARDGDLDGVSYVLFLRIDAERKIVTLKRRFQHPQAILSTSQGSVEVLNDTGSVMVGWGHSAAFTEFSVEGKVLCDARFGAAAVFSFGAVTSYRVFRGRWVGKPQYPPNAVVSGGKIYVSWNGATEVASWSVEATGRWDELADDDFHRILQASRTGFETEIELWDGVAYPIMRVSGLDKDGRVLGTSQLVHERLGHGWMTPLAILAAAALILVISMALLLWLGLRSVRRRRRTSKWRLRRAAHYYEPLLQEEETVPLRPVPRRRHS